MTIENILMPQLGESVTEGTISKWLVAAGDTVKKYDPIAEVMTDKVNAEVPSTFTGTIKELVASEGDTINVGELIAYIDVEGAKTDSSHPAHEAFETQTVKEAPDKQEDQSMKRRYSPAVLRLAQQHGLDLEQINGSGRGGRITRKDVQAVIHEELDSQEEKPDAFSTSTQPESTSATPSEQPAITTTAGDVEVPVTGVRKAIAANMVQSKQEAPHAWTMVETDVTNLAAYRNTIKNEFKQKERYGLTFLPFFIKAVVEALKEFPRVNSVWGGDKIIQKGNINISIAVATEEALYVPVIKNADEKSIKGLAKSVNELSGKVRNHQLSQADMEGGTFTVNNTGSFGSVLSAPIINRPQAAILSVESIVKRPVVINDMIAIRDMVNLCLSLDHRVLDGLICGRFLASIKKKLEDMTRDNLSIY